MKRDGATARFRLPFLLLVASFLAGPACSFDGRGIAIDTGPNAQEFYKCTAKLKHCAPGEEAVQVTAAGPAQYNVAGTYKVDTDFRPADHLYVNSPNQWIVKDIELDALKGAALVQTDWNHWSVDAGYLLGVDFPSFEHIQDVYVAYDSRANPKPQWLLNTGDYQPVVGGGKQLSIVTYTPDASSAAGTVRLDLYRVVSKIKGHPLGEPMWKIPGNSCFAPPAGGTGACTGKVKWPSVPDKNKAMYVVVVVRKPAPDCSKGTVDEQKVYESCMGLKTDAATVAGMKCEDARQAKAKIGQNPAYFQCLPATCRVELACPKQSPLVQPRSFTISSVVEFEPAKYKSEAVIQVAGQKFTKKVKGLVYFEYQLDEFGAMRRMRLDAMKLEVEPIDSDAGKFTDIVIALRDTAGATCQESPPPWAGDRPCTDYRIRAGAFKALLGAKEGQKLLLFDPQNQGTLDIKIDHKNRTFQIKGGPLTTSVQVNGDSKPLAIDIDLFGHFLNFAPHAVGGKESTKWVECSGGRDKSPSNKDPIILDSAGSFEVYKDPIPQTSYEWYEDYTWPPQKLWGTGSQLAIGPHQMGLGVHDMTLLIRDPFGVADTDTFPVEVRDTQPPTITVPPDAYYLVTPPDQPPVKVPLGKAWAYDTCFGDVDITNDAPPDGRFPAGVTPVTWTAEDGAGNKDTGVQKVYVFTAPKTVDPKVLVPKIKDFAKYVKAGIDQSKGAAERCDEAALRAASAGGLARATSQMAGLAQRMDVAPGRAGEQREAIEMLRLSETRLGEADGMLESARSAKREADRRELCASAAGSLGDAGGLVVKAVPLLDRAGAAPPAIEPPAVSPPTVEPPPEPPPSREPGAAGPDLAARCQAYARVSVAHGTTNRQRGCGFQGGRWSGDFRAHYDWCLKNSPEAAEAMMLARERALGTECRPRPVPMPSGEPPPAWPPIEQGPGKPSPPPPAAPSGKEAFCQTYAQMAVSSAQQNLSRGCGFTGPRWLTDFGAHYNWCLGVPQFLADMETNARAGELGRCGGPRPPTPQAPPPPSPPPSIQWPTPPPPTPGPAPAPDRSSQMRCAAYAQQAVSQANQNAERRCGFTGPRWSTDYNTHLNWCLGVPEGAANGEAAVRTNALRDQCRTLQ